MPELCSWALNTANQAVNVTLGAAQTWNVGAGGLTVTNFIGGLSTGLTKTGAGNLTINTAAVNGFAGGLNANAGTLTLNFANLATPTDLIAATNALTLGGGALTITGKNAAGTTNQTFASTTLNAGVSTINITKGATASSANLILGPLTISPGSVTMINPGTVWATNVPSTTEIVNITTYNGTALPASGTKLNVNAGLFYRQSASQGAARWVNVDSAGRLQAIPAGIADLADLEAVTVARAISNITLTGSTSSYGLLANATSTAKTLNLGNSSYTINGIVGMGSAKSTIAAGTSGTILIGSERNLVVTMDHTGALDVNAPIVDNGGGASGVTIASTIPSGTPGVLTFGGANTFTGQLRVLNSTLSIASTNDVSTNGVLGNSAFSVILGGTGQTGTLAYTAASGTSTKPFTMTTGGTGALNVTTALTLNGLIDGGGALTKSGAGILTLGAANTYSGATTISAGTLRLAHSSAVSGTTAITLTAAGTSLQVGTDTAFSGPRIVSTAGTIVSDRATSGAGLTHAFSGISRLGSGNTDITAGANVTSGTAAVQFASFDNDNGTVANFGLNPTTANVIVVGGVNMGGGANAGDANFTLTGTITGNSIGGAIVNGARVNANLIKSGFSTWSLSGANTYNGTTTINAGTLSLSGANTGTGTIILNAGTLDLGGGTATGSLASPTLTLAGGTFAYTRTGTNTQSFTTTNINSSTGLISVAAGNTLNLGTVVRGAGGWVDFSTTGAGIVAADTSSNVTGIMPGFSFGSNWAVANGAGVAISGLSSYTLTSVATTAASNYAGNNIDVNDSSGVLDGAITTNSLRFNTAAANTLTLTGTPNIITSGGILVSSGVGANLSTIAGGDLTGAAITNLNVIQNNTLGGLTISSVIVNNTATGLSKSGAGLLTLTGANTYTGGTTVNAGTLQLSGLGRPGALGSNVSVSSGALLDLNGTNQNITFVVGAGVGTVANNSGSGTSILTMAGTATINGGLVTIVDSTTTPGGKVGVVITATTTTMSNLNTYSGDTTVNAGAFLYLSSATTSGAGTGSISLPASGASIALCSGLLVDGATYANDVSGAGYIHNNVNGTATAVFTGTLNTSGTFNFRSSGAAFNFAGSGNSTLSGIIGPSTASGVAGPNATVSSGSVIKSGTGTLTLSGPNVFSGSLSVQNGTLAIPAINNASVVGPLGNSATAVTLGSSGNTGKLRYTGASATSTKPFALATGGTGSFDVSTLATDLKLSGVISGSGAMVKTGPGTLTLAGTNTYSGGTTLNEGTLVLDSTGKTNPATILPANTALTIETGTTVNLIGNTLNSIVNSSAGTITIGSGGSLNLNHTTNNSFNFFNLTLNEGSVTQGGGAITSLLGANLAVRGTIRATEDSTISASLAPFPVNGTTPAYSTTLDVSANKTLAVSGFIRNNNIGGAVNGITKTGDGTLRLTATNNSYTGNTVVNAGTLALADNAQLRFVLGTSSGANNQINGAGTTTLDGDFNIVTSAADGLASGTWTIIDHSTLTETYTTNFSVVGFTAVGATKWTKPNGPTKLYTFDEATGQLTLGPSASYASWIAGFSLIGPDALATADPDNDGIDNAVEMVLGGNPATGMDTALLPTIEMVTDPAGVPAGNYLLFTYRRTDLSVTAGVTATCETDTNLVGLWTTAVGGVDGVVILTDDNYASFTPPAADTDRVRVYVPRGANLTLFGRLNVLVP